MVKSKNAGIQRLDALIFSTRAIAAGLMIAIQSPTV